MTLDEQYQTGNIGMDVKIAKALAKEKRHEVLPTPEVKRHKYGVSPKAQRTNNGIVYASKKEMLRSIQLDWLVKLGEISDLDYQVTFVLQEGFIDNQGNKIRPITYIADFVYKQGSETIVEDVKGMKTAEYKLKKKMFLKQWQQYVFKEV